MVHATNQASRREPTIPARHGQVIAVDGPLVDVRCDDRRLPHLRSWFAPQVEGRKMRTRLATITYLGDAVVRTVLASDGAGITIGIPDGPGFHISSGTLAVAVVTPSAADQAAGDNRSWLALTALISSASLTASGAPLHSITTSTPRPLVHACT